MAFGGSSSYAPGSSTTTVQTRPGGVDPTAAIMAMIAREKQAYDRNLVSAQQPAAPSLGAAPTAPVMESRSAPTSTDAARALANRSSGEGAARPSFVHLSGVGPQQVSGWTDAPEGAGNVFGGWRVTDGGGPVHVAESGNISDHFKARDAADLSLENQRLDLESKKRQAAGNGGGQHADWYGLGKG